MAEPPKENCVALRSVGVFAAFVIIPLAAWALVTTVTLTEHMTGLSVELADLKAIVLTHNETIDRNVEKAVAAEAALSDKITAIHSALTAKGVLPDAQ